MTKTTTDMQERNIINGTASVLLTPLADFYTSLAPYFVLAIVLIVVDARFGIEAAVRRGEKIRRSRMVRRSINKLVDYICWVTLAGMFGRVFGEELGIPLLSVVLLVIIYGIEITSCFNNYFEAHGITRRVNLFRLLGRGKVDLADVVEENPDNSKPKNEKQ